MAGGALAGEVVELTACNGDDPDGSRTAAVVGAYFEAEHARDIRRLLWPRLGILAVVWVLLAVVLLSKAALIGGLLVIGAAAGCAAVFEWRRDRKLGRLLRTSRGSVARSYFRTS